MWSQTIEEAETANLSESGLSVEIEKTVVTTRGSVNIDVYAEDPEQNPTTRYICECKLWRNRIPKDVVHALRTVVADFGANWGFVISQEGFQTGAHEAD